MQSAQADLVEWARHRLAFAREQAEDLRENLEIATRNKWGTGGLSRAHKRAIKDVEFYEKVLAALEAGYCLVPNFPVDIFAIRTTRKSPKAGESTSRWTSHEQQSNSPPLGEGKIVSSQPEVRQEDRGEENKNDRYLYYATEFQEVEFPFTVAKPLVLQATERAAAEKIFDELGVVGPPNRRGDPIIVGRIHNRRGQPGARVLSFLVAWWIDTRDL